MRVRAFQIILLVVCVSTLQAGGPRQGTAAKTGGEASFSKDVFPIIKKNCLPCHAESEFNPSELFLDSHELLMTGGKHGAAVVPGKPKESLLVRKLGEKPPFGDRMPLDPKRRKGEPPKKVLSEEDVKTISGWIEQGAKNN